VKKRWNDYLFQAFERMNGGKLDFFVRRECKSAGIIIYFKFLSRWMAQKSQKSGD
jgi:hypothetical protein